MAKGNKYYWLKLKEDFFEDDAINWIEEQPNGKDYCLFYLKLCLKSLKSNGILIRNVGNMLVPYDVKKLSDLTNTDIDTVKVAMDMFRKIGLVDVLENGEIFMNQLQTMVGKETDYAEQKRIQRENKKEIEQKDNVHLVSFKSPEIVHTEKEIDLEKEKEKELDIDFKEIENNWNSKERLTKIRSITKVRKDKTILRIKENSFNDFMLAIDKINSSDFATGENKNNWSATYDWLVENDSNITKVLEGNYDNKNNKQQFKKQDEKGIDLNGEQIILY